MEINTRLKKNETPIQKISGKDTAISCINKAIDKYKMNFGNQAKTKQHKLGFCILQAILYYFII